MRSLAQISRWARWLFALVIFVYLWREGGYWRYVAAGGFALMVILLTTLVNARLWKGHKDNRKPGS